VLHGALLMVAYAIGRGIILAVVAFSAGIIKEVKEGKLAHYIERISGAVILLASLYLLFFYEFSRLPMPNMNM
jgi:cytochrome c biogenesis protein CcdA